MKRNFKRWYSENHDTGRQSSWLEIIKFDLVVEWDCLRSSQGVVSTTGEQSREFNSTAPRKSLVNAKGACRKHSYVKDVKYSMIAIIA